MATSRKIGFFYAKNRAPPRGSAQGTCCARLSLSAPKSRGTPRDIPRLPRGAVSRVCACAVARVGRVGVPAYACVGRVGVCARRARRARSRRRSRRFCRKSVDPSVFPPYLQEGVRINMRGYAARRPAKHFSANEKKDYTVSRCPAPGGCGRAVKGRKLPSGIPGLPPGTYILYPVRKNFSRRQI